MRVVLSEVLTHHPEPVSLSEIGVAGAEQADVDAAIARLTSDNYVDCNEQGELSLSSSFAEGYF
jgi:hypothetical protein